MAAEQTILLIALIAVLGFGLAWLVGRVADRDKAKRAEETAMSRNLPDAPPAPPAGAPAAAVAAGGAACPTCRTPYRPEAKFCWACGRDRA